MAADTPPVGPGLYKLLVEQARDYAVFALDNAGRLRARRAAAQRIKGDAPEGSTGRDFSVFYPHGSVASGWPAHELKVAAAEGRFEGEGWRVRKDGARFWASVVITALRDEEG